MKLVTIIEILRDAKKCARLTPWEEKFCTDMRARIDRDGAKTWFSDNQLQSICQIEKKVYAT